MAASKTAISTGLSATAVAAGGTSTGTAMDLTTAYGADVTVQIVTTTAPTTVGTVTIQSSATTGGTWVTRMQGGISMSANQTLTYAWEIPPAVGAIRIVITAGTGTGITATAQCNALTG